MKKNSKEIINIVEEYEAKLRKLGSFSLKEDLELSTKSIQDFLVDFFYYNHLSSGDTKNPLYPNQFTGTYKTDSIGRKTLQCNSHRRRSIGDLFQLAIGYYREDISLMEVMEAVMNIVNNHIPLSPKDGKYTYYMYVTTCSTIHRRVFNTSTSKSYLFNSSNNDHSTPLTTNHDEFSIKLEDYITLYDSGEFESYRKEKELSRRKSSKSINKEELDEIDKLIAEKIAKLLEDNSDKASLIKKVSSTTVKKKKRVLV